MSFKNGPHMSQGLSFWVQGLALEVPNWSTPTEAPCPGGISSVPYQQPESIEMLLKGLSYICWEREAPSGMCV